MKLILSYLGKLKGRLAAAMTLKFLAAMFELLLPRILTHIIDEIVPTGQVRSVVLWGLAMILVAALTAGLNILANRAAVRNAKEVAYAVRQDLFEKTARLSGTRFDLFTLPSLTSRMTSDSYNIQQFAQTLQAMCVRAPFLMLGGILMMFSMDVVLASILVAIIIPLGLFIFFVSRKGIPLFNVVQEKLDRVVRIMRENITGIRVVKALSKKNYEQRRFDTANEEMYRSNTRASTVMALPGPVMNLCLNAGLALVVYVGASRVNTGAMKPGVILGSLTYFNTILMSVMALNRIFIMLSKASASANRIADVLASPEDQPVLSPEECRQPAGDELIRMEHVRFRYQEAREEIRDGEQALALDDISFAVKEGESLGIIGPTGAGKSTVLQLLMRFYDVKDGGVFIAGRDVRGYEPDELRSQFGVVFQNDMVFNDTLFSNVDFGRSLTTEQVDAAVKDAMAADFVYGLKGGLDFVADIKGANLSGGQKQRLLIARSLAARPRILILDDSSSALDYRTDAQLRRTLAENYQDSTLIMIAQRVSSVRHLTNILVLKDGACIGYGPHDELMKTCDYYRDICTAQMGALE